MKFKDRTEYIGASEAAAAMGQSPYQSQFELWCRKTGRAGDITRDPVMDRGNDHEEMITNRAADEYGMTILDRQMEFAVADGEWGAWLRCHVDGIIQEWTEIPSNNAPMEGRGVLEVKAPGWRMLKKFAEDGLTADYIVQMQVCLMLADMEWGRYALYDYEAHSVICFDVRRNRALTDMIMTNLTTFWTYVRQDIVPLPDDEPIVIPEYGGDQDSIDGDEAQEACAKYITFHQAEAAAKAGVASAKSDLLQVIGDSNAKVMLLSGMLRINRACVTRKPTIDGMKLAEFTASLAAAIVDDDTKLAVKMAGKYELGNFQKAQKPYTRMSITGVNEFKGDV